MKKVLLMALVAVTILSSCSKQDDIDNPRISKASLSVKVDLSKFVSPRSGDDNIITGTPPVYDQILFVVKTKGPSPQTVSLTKSVYTKLELENLSNKVTLIEKTDNGNNLIGGTVEVYLTTEGHDWGTLLVSAPTIVADQPDINNWQPSGNITTGVTGKFENVPYYAKTTITHAGVNPADGHELLEANLTATPELGRIQVLNAPSAGGEKGDYTVSTLNLVGIYINNITSNNEIKDVRETGASAVSGWESKYYTGASAILEGMWDNSTNKGYQIFGGSTPHIIIKVTYKLTKGEEPEGPTLYTGYITIQKFTNDDLTEIQNKILTILKGKIYDIDLKDLVPTYDQITDNPYDNTLYYDLVATVTVNPWTKVSVTPEL